jgi:hypothetical protein
MAAAGEFKIMMSNGTTLSCYGASAAAIGAVIPALFSGIAAAGTTVTDWSPQSDCCIRDIVSISPATGSIDFYNVSRGRRADKVVDLAGYYAANTARAIPPICFKAGQTYRIIVCATFIT